MKIPTRMPSGGRILGICILGVAIRENPDTYAFWGSHFGYLHSGARGTGKSARAQGTGTGTVKNGAVIRLRQFCNGANTGRLASRLKSMNYFCKNGQF